MAVKEVTKAVEAKVEKAAAPKVRYIELHGHKRYMWFGKGMFEAGVAYPVNDDQLEEFLTHRNDGITPFRLYQEPKKEVELRRVKGVSVPVAPLPTPTSAEVVDSAKPKAIEIGSDDEIADLLPADEDGVVEV